MSASKESSQSYSVGYRRPPISGRFQKGLSGNPKGKASGRKSLSVELLEELNQELWYRSSEDYAAWARATFVREGMLIEQLGLAAK